MPGVVEIIIAVSIILGVYGGICGDEMFLHPNKERWQSQSIGNSRTTTPVRAEKLVNARIGCTATVTDSKITCYRRAYPKVAQFSGARISWTTRYRNQGRRCRCRSLKKPVMVSRMFPSTLFHPQGAIRHFLITWRGGCRSPRWDGLDNPYLCSRPLTVSDVSSVS